jgi:3(or 17)beta-hydroxysteroid dehydrogenase
MGRVNSKVALITGAAQGLGEASARALHQQGATVVVADVNLKGGQALVAELGHRALFVELDVTSEAAWQKAIVTTVDQFGRLDVLVNNAGIVLMGTIEDTSLEDLRRIQSVNVEGPFLGCKHAIPAMAQTGGGSIINMSSIAAFSGTPAFAAYSATKGAVRSLTQTVATHCKQRNNGIRCNSIHPGGMATPMIESLMTLAEQSPMAAEMLVQTADLSEAVGKPEDVANAVVYFASDESSFVNGSLLTIDNGFMAS